MTSERFKSASPDQLAEDLTRFLYARDYSFAQGITDVTEQRARRESRTYVDSDGDDILVPVVAERFKVSARRNIYVDNWKKNMPSHFVISHKRITHVDELPPQLRHVLDSELVTIYDETLPGDLNEVHGVDYGVVVDQDGVVSIGRNLNYKLRDIKEVVYKASEMKSPKTVKVPVLSEDDTIRMRLEDLPEHIPDLGLQVLVGVDFSDLINGTSTDFDLDQLDAEIFDQIACVNALLNSMVTGRPIRQTAL